MEIKIDNKEATEILKKHLEKLMPGKKVTIETMYNHFSFIVEEPPTKADKNPVGMNNDLAARPCLNS